MSKSNNITDILKGYQYRNSNKGIFVTIDTVNGKEEVAIKSEYFYSMIADDFQKANNGDTVSMKTIKDAILNYQGNILKTHPKVDTKLRVSTQKNGTVLLIDKGGKDDHYFKITQNGWYTKTGGNKFFTRNHRQAELPEPVQGRNIDLLFKYCRVPESMQHVLIAYVVSCFIGDILHPCLVVQGEAGSSKTTFCTFLKMLIDPCKNNAPCIFPKSETELKDVYNGMYLVAYDNLDRLNRKQSDALCSIITGSQVVKRKLYTDAESCTYDLRNPVILNGISNIISKEDLLDRSIIMELLPIPPEERKSEKALMRAFQKDLPDILGGIFDILVQVLSTYQEDSVSNPPRMIDFYEYGYYICEAIGVGSGDKFTAEYWNLINTQKGNYTGNRLLFDTIVTLLEYEENFLWQGTMQELSETLNELLEECGRGKEIPPTPNRLSRELHLMADMFEENSILAKYARTANNSCHITLSLKDD